MKTLFNLGNGRSIRTARWACVLLVLVALALGGASAIADALGQNTIEQIKALMAEKESRTPEQLKMDSQLVFAAKLARGEVIAPGITNLTTTVELDANLRVHVDMDSTVNPDLLNAIAAAGGSVVNSFPQFHAIRAWMPIGQIAALAGRPDVRFIRAAVKCIRRTGSVDSQGDVSHMADQARLDFGVDGSGIKVGVISDSVDFMTTSQATGDLPQDVVVLPGQSGMPGSGEGTAMLEIVNDLAPGAKLFFATGFAGAASFAQNIIDLRAAGCDIIVDDIGYADESPFQDMIIARAVNQVTADGALYFSAAGNANNLAFGTSGTWEGDFTDGGAVTITGGKSGRIHSFGTNNFDQIIGPGGLGCLFWSDPLGASTNDYDLYVVDPTGTILSASTTTQNGTQDPIEMTGPMLPGARVVVVLASGTNRFLHFDIFGGGTLAIQTAGNVRGHACATNAFAVSATEVLNSYPNPFSGGSINPVEDFSSDGPRRVFFNENGTPITPTNYLATGGYVRPKPDVTAADGVSTTVPGFDPFHGTSAAAPHAAAIAALLLSYNPTLTPDQVRLVLTSTSLDIMAPGWDTNSGSGIVMAYQALAAAPPPAPAPRLLVVTNFVIGGNGNGLIDPDECNELSLVLTNAGGADATGVRLTLVTTNAGVTMVKRTVTSGTIPASSLSSNIPPFRVSTSPAFVCGVPIDFQLVMKTDQNTRTNYFRVQTGAVGNPVRYDSSVAVPIPDGDPLGVSSPILVTNLAGSVGKVTVSLHLTHTYDSDLTLQLIAPDGTTSTLAAGVGGSGWNFGASCADADRTVFDDGSTNPISTGTAPFVGTFRPSQFLTVFSGKPSTVANGVWQLHVVDQEFFNSGAIECWSLFLSPALCNDGGGQCPGVDMTLGMADLPDPVVQGSNLVYTITVTNLGPNTAKGVVVTHKLPTTAIYVSSYSSQGSVGFSGGLVTANLGQMAIGATASVTVLVLPATTGVISSTATVTSIDPEIDPVNNSATIQTVVLPPSSDLAAGLFAAPSPTVVGAALTYTATVTNHGPATATQVVLSNTLPATVLINSASSSQGIVATYGNVVVGSLGMLTNGGWASVTIRVTPLADGTINATARASGSQPDPLLSNNSVALATSVGQSADVGITLVDGPDPVVVRSNFTYVATVKNRGPSVATDVVVSQILPVGVNVFSTNVSQGTVSLTNSSVKANLGSLAVGASATLTIVLNSTNLGTLTSSATVNAGQFDPNPGDNTASASTTVALPFVSIVPAGAKLRAENYTPPDGAIDIGETVTLDLRLRNAGNVNNTNLVATLLATNGVTSPSGPQVYGVLPPSGLPVSRPFTFTATGTNGGNVIATLQLTDGTSNLPPATFTFPLPKVATFRNTNAITIPSVGAATPYPATLTVAGIMGTVGKVTVTLNNLTHSYPSDVAALVKGPQGQNALLMSGAGLYASSANVLLTFDESATNALPPTGQITGGSYLPSAYIPNPAFPAPAPAGPYSAALTSFAGVNPNGTWSLFVVDENNGDAGNIAQGWSVAVTTVTPINQLAELNLAGTVAPTSVLVGGMLTNTFVVTNGGPSVATGVAFTNALPGNVRFVSAASPQGTCATNGSLVTCTIPTLEVGASATISVVVMPAVAGVISNYAVVALNEIDLNLANNVASTVASASLPIADVLVTQTGAPVPVIVASNLTYYLIVTNQGPETALAVQLANTLPAGVAFGSATVSTGSWTNLDGVVTCSFGSLLSGASATATITVTPTNAVALTNLAVVSTTSADPAALNNTNVLVIAANNPAPIIAAGNSWLTSESATPPNGAIDTGETVTLMLSLTNAGQAATSPNFAAMLMASDGVVPIAPVTQTYGVLTPGGPAAARPFKLTASGVPGGNLSVSLHLMDGATDLGVVVFHYVFPSMASFANSGFISIPDHGTATPYPATVTVAGLTGVVSKAVVTLNQFNHSFPRDVSVLLVGPQGQSVTLMAGVGGPYPATNLVLTLDDTSSNSLPVSAALYSGTFKPANYKPGMSFPAPVPGGSRAPTLASFNGSDPNGVWSLYVMDDSVGDAGNIAQGFSLSLTTIQPVSPLADLAVSLAVSTNSVFTGTPLTYTITVSNRGPATSSAMIVTNLLPIGAQYLSAVPSQGVSSNVFGTQIWVAGNLAAGATATLNVHATLTSAGIATDAVTVTGSETDLDPSNNGAFVAVTVYNPMPSRLAGAYNPADGAFNLTITGQPTLTYVLSGSSDLSTWMPLSTNVMPAGGVWKYSDTGATNYPNRFYRTLRQP